MGWDTYPIIISSRVQSLGDLAGSFTEKLMDGRYADDFYRPLLNLSFALDYALWGPAPGRLSPDRRPALRGVRGGAVWLMTRRACGPGSQVAPLAALAVFLLHPTNWEVIPVPSRRPELLCCLFMALSVAAQLAPRALAARRPPIWPAIFTALAIASKETALVLPVLSFVAVALYSARPSIGQRLRHAATALIPHAVRCCRAAGRAAGRAGWNRRTPIDAARGRHCTAVCPRAEVAHMARPPAKRDAERVRRDHAANRIGGRRAALRHSQPLVPPGFDCCPKRRPTARSSGGTRGPVDDVDHAAIRRRRLGAAVVPTAVGRGRGDARWSPRERAGCDRPRRQRTPRASWLA